MLFDKTATCRFCGSIIIFAENALAKDGENGAMKPIDVFPTTAGNIVLRSKRFRHLHLTAENLPKIKSRSGDQIFIECRFEILRFATGEQLFQFHYKSCTNKPARPKRSRFGGKI